MRTPSHPATDSIQLAGIFHALSDPARLSIVTGLSEVDEQCCSDLDIPLSKSTLSHHLKVLREAGVTTTRVEGTRRLMSLRRDDLGQRFPGLLDAVLDAATREPADAH